MACWKVAAIDSGLSLQAFLRKHVAPVVSAKEIKRAIDSGKCKLNGKIERFSTRLVGLGDRIEVVDFAENREIASIANNLQILYSDNEIVACHKPSGASSDSISLLASLEKLFGRLILLHRLDKGTSGVLLFARNEAAAREVEALFKKRLVTKTYYAIVDGVPPASKGRIDNFLGKLHAYAGGSFWGSVSKGKGVAAATAWEIDKVGDGAALILCHPETGRTHQIRVHLSEMGYPILGDHQYCRRFTCPYQVPRLMLHAAEIQFIFPTNNKLLQVRAPLPPDFKDTLKALRVDA